MAEKIQEESAAVKAARARVEAKKALSNKMTGEDAILAAIAADENAEDARLEAEAKEALKARAEVVEATVRAALAETGKKTPIVCLCDRATELLTGLGIVVVGAPDAISAKAALSKAGKVVVGNGGEASVESFDGSSGGVLAGLLKSALYVGDGRESAEQIREFVAKPQAARIQKLHAEAFGMAQRAHQAAVGMTGAWAEETRGKSPS